MTDAFPLPTNLADDDRRDWIRRLPATVDHLTRRWSLSVGAPFQPGGECSWTAPAVDRAGREVVLKVGWTHFEALHEAEGLRHWAGHGAVMVHDSYIFGDTRALVLERCTPGTPLNATVSEPEQDEVVASLLRRLWQAPARPTPFRPLQGMCDAWVDEFRAKLDAGRTTSLDPVLVDRGLELFRALPATAEREAVLCTDLHAGNILAAQREPWLVIDPKPYLGDPTYDPLQHLLNCDERLTADPVGFARRMASLLDLDPERLTTWLFARCVLESVEQPYLAGVATRLAPG